MSIKIWCDQDGVLADYNKAYRELGGDPTEKGSVKAKRLKSHPHFYRTLPMMPDALVLWKFLEQYHPSIMTAASNYVPYSREDKIEWLEEHLHLTDPKRITVVNYPQDKQKHCRPGDILIDDNTKNCSEWINAGGVAVIHHNAEQTIRKLKEILGHPTEHVQEAFQALAETPGTPNLVEAFGQRIGRLCYCSEFPIPAEECTNCKAG